MRNALCLMLLGIFTLSACNEAAKTDSSAKTDSTAVAAETTKPATTLSKEEADKAWMDYMTPGTEHELLAKETGKWKTEMQTWMSPDSPAIKSTGTAEIKMIIGGRYQEGNFKGDMMGMAFEGRNITAFDKVKKVYISTWIDNMGTGMMVSEGKVEPDGKTMISTGKMVDPTTGKESDVREIWKMVDDKTRTMEMYTSFNGKEFKTMEMKMIKQ